MKKKKINRFLAGMMMSVMLFNSVAPNVVFADGEKQDQEESEEYEDEVSDNSVSEDAISEEINDDESDLSVENEQDYIVDEIPGIDYLNGTGTELNPYIINDKESLIEFCDAANNGEDFADKYIEITEDIYLNDISDYENWSDTYAPATIWPGLDSFGGHIDGNNHTIYGLYNADKSDNLGFIRKADQNTQAEVCGLSFESIYITGGNFVGGIVGWASNIKITGCTVNGKINGVSNVGGYAGKIQLKNNIINEISNSKNYAIINGNRAGGFVGFVHREEETGKCWVLKDCVNYGDVNGAITANYNDSTGAAGQAGGFVGYTNLYDVSSWTDHGEVEITRLINHGNINSNGTRDGSSAGGIFGDFLIFAYNPVYITECANYGAITGDGSVGGITGLSSAQHGGGKVHIHTVNCANYGVISGSNKTGGIIGRSYTQGYVENCCNFGLINGKQNYGAIVGCADTGHKNLCTAVSNCYYVQKYNENALGGNGAYEIGDNIVAIPDDQSSDESKYSSLDFDNIWTMGNRFPMLQIYQNESTPDNSSDFSGCGSLDDPYIIDSKDTLLKLSTNVNSGNKYANKYFVITNDIKLNDISDYNLWSET